MVRSVFDGPNINLDILNKSIDGEISGAVVSLTPSNLELKDFWGKIGRMPLDTNSIGRHIRANEWQLRPPIPQGLIVSEVVDVALSGRVLLKGVSSIDQVALPINALLSEPECYLVIDRSVIQEQRTTWLVCENMEYFHVGVIEFHGVRILNKCLWREFGLMGKRDLLGRGGDPICWVIILTFRLHSILFVWQKDNDS